MNLLDGKFGEESVLLKIRMVRDKYEEKVYNC